MKETMGTEALIEMMSKVSDKISKTSTMGNVRGIGVDDMLSESKRSQLSTNKARVLRKMSPSLDRGLQILAGMISCPEGGVRTNLNYTLGDVDGLTEEKKNKLIIRLKEYFDVTLDMENSLNDIVYRVISEIGAEVEVYLPVSMVSEVMGMESSGYIKDGLSDTVNPIKYDSNSMSINSNMDLLSQSHINIKPMVGNESGKGNGTSRISRINRTTLALNDTGKYGNESVIVRHTTGASVIPILYNGRVIKYVGILDDMGSFVTSTDTSAFMDLMSSSGDVSEDNIMATLSRDVNRKDSSELNRYRNVRRSIENDVIKALTGKDAANSPESIVKSLGEENVLDILAARALVSKKTRVILLDPEYVSYFSLIENDFGRGITIIEDNSAIILLHVTLLYAKILSELESSIPQTTCSARLDENDQTSESTIKDIMGELALTAIPEYDIDYSGNREMFRSLSRMNTSVKIENADVPGMPNMDISVDRTQKDVRPPSSDLLETVGKYANQSLGISSDHIDNSYSEKFKLQVTRDNDITNRQLTRYISSVNRCLTDRGRKRVAHDDKMWDDLMDIVGSKGEDKLVQTLSTLQIRLPELTSSKFENLTVNMESITRSIEDYLKIAISDTVIESGERIDADTLSTMREMVSSAVIRTYAQNSDLFGGLGLDLTSMSGIAEIVNNELEDYGDEFKGMAKNIRKFNKKITKATDIVESEEEEEPEEPEEPTPNLETSTEEGADDTTPETTDVPEEGAAGDDPLAGLDLDLP